MHKNQIFIYCTIYLLPAILKGQIVILILILANSHLKSFDSAVYSNSAHCKIMYKLFCRGLLLLPLFVKISTMNRIYPAEMTAAFYDVTQLYVPSHNTCTSTLFQAFHPDLCGDGLFYFCAHKSMPVACLEIRILKLPILVALFRAVLACHVVILCALLFAVAP